MAAAPGDEAAVGPPAGVAAGAGGQLAPEEEAAAWAPG